MVAHIFYVLSLISYLAMLLFFLWKNKKSKEDEETMKNYDFLFLLLSILLLGVNFYCVIHLLNQNHYFQSYFSSIGAPVLFLFMTYIPLTPFFVKKYQYDRHGNRIESSSHPTFQKNPANNIYLSLAFSTCFIVSFFPSYLLFAVLQLPLDATLLSGPILLALLGVIGLYLIGLSIYRMRTGRKKAVSYPSIIVSIFLLLVSSYCYSLILDRCISINVGVFGYINIFALTGFLLLISYIIISKKTIKHCFKDYKRVLLLKDGFLILQIAGIMNGILLPLASVVFVVLDHFHLISA